MNSTPAPAWAQPSRRVRPRRRGRRAAVAVALALGLAAPLAVTPVAHAAPIAAEVDLVDPDATPETRSLFAYLRDIDAEGVLFGHQEDLYFGESFPAQDGTSSDTLTATGDHPAVIGFDTLETAGMPLAEREAKAQQLAANIRQAHDVGAISTLTIHMENLATGGDFYDTSGDALRAVLPGGAQHDALRAYLDRIAATAHAAVAADGTAIPIVFRPWHENAGSWFWWGAAFGLPGEYAELFRFTVEYLRDVKDVHNLLYAFSPGGGFGGDEDLYLRTYPGDDFVDVLGYDVYDSSGAAQSFLDGLVADLGMMGRLAQARGKISALTEFGISGGVRPDGENANVTWFTDVLDAIMSDPDAARTAYMMTWANYGGDSTPYFPVEGEMLPDFQAYHDDPRTFFADDLAGVYDADTASVASAAAHLASPADGARVVAGPVELRASVTGHAADRVTVTTDAGDVIELAAPADGGMWWTGAWEVAPEQLDNTSHGLTLRVFAGGAEVETTASTVVLGPEPVLPLGVVDDFESYDADAALQSRWVPQNANVLELARAAEGDAVGGGEAAMRLSYSFATQSYTGAGRPVAGDWSSFWDFQAWIDPDASGNRLVLQLVADGVAFEAYPSLAGDDPYLATIPFADWRPAPWDTANADRRLTPEALAHVSQFSVFVNAADAGAVEGSIVVDELRAVEGTPPPPVYVDVERDAPDYAAIAWLHDEVVNLGDANGRFHPTRPVTRAEATHALAAYREDAPAVDGTAKAPVERAELAHALWELAGAPTPAEPADFDDVPPAHPSAEAIAWVTQNGIVEPAGDGRFGMRGPVTRAELARALRAFDAAPGTEPPTTLFDFADGPQGWAANGAIDAADGRLTVDLAESGWIWATGSWDLSGRSTLVIDVAETTGTSIGLALQVGPSWSWCELPAGDPVSGGASVAIDLGALSSECRGQLGDVRGVNLRLDAGQHAIDAIRVR
ncbi:glycosyl hydrolase [Microbacterium sp. JZ37]|uniref:glycosyl hydrolase n=1 Tax=Microbacterium sp. JZ37 TaxID=2654193 RepID=UPI002B48079C|nr:glycosyl hydrolase [Microbacterium sp. JZ37]WRH16702.1 hypothetical protein GC092_03635 [Microbacterium sp. JZ37]